MFGSNDKTEALANLSRIAHLIDIEREFENLPDSAVALKITLIS